MAEQIKDVIKQEYIKCAKDPVYFLMKYCMIQHPIRGKIPFSLYGFQQDTIRDFVDNRFNIILKARQLGISTLTAGYSLWMMTFFQDKNIPEVAEVISEETLSNEQDFKIESELKLEDDINELHNEINNFFIQDKLDSIHLDVTVDASEPKA